MKRTWTKRQSHEVIEDGPPSRLTDQTLRERREFAAKIRGARAILGWSQAELGTRIGINQRSINRLERAQGDVRRSTAVAIETLLKSEGIVFEEVSAGGFKIIVSADKG